MTHPSIQDILPLVEMPSQYIGSEINAIKKNPAQADVSIALAFPDLYVIGTSHFGIQILYNILNSRDNICAERVYTPNTDMESRIRGSGCRLSSLESGRPLTRFDIIGFSLLYELNYTNILTMLDLAGIPFFAKDRDLSFPLIVAGGPCTCNPEPVADFFDAMVIGDGESAILEMADSWIKWKKAGGKDKTSLLKSWSTITGVYIPYFFKPAYDASGFQVLTPLDNDYKTVLRTIIPSLDKASFPDRPVVPFGRPVHDRLRLEISRGCSRGCRFCQAGMIYRPVRERSINTLMEQAKNSLAATGYDELSLLSLSTSDYGCMPELMGRLIKKCAPENIAVSLPSFRAGTLTPELMTRIKQIRKTGFTIAPEAGSQRLRNVINKNITREDIVSTVQDAFSLGWQVIKLYFMIGLPTETDEDLEAMAELVADLRKLKIRKSKSMKGHKNQINVSVNTFIPKPHTPFQWASLIHAEESWDKINRLKEKLHYSDVQFKWQDPRVGILEGLWARGDRRLSRLLVEAYSNGCRLDGWSDHFNYLKWEKSLQETGIDTGFYTTRTRDIAEPLPWDHIDTRVEKEYLISEWKKSLKQEFTPDCRWGECQSCGVCDFKTIEPIVFSTVSEEAVEPERDAGSVSSAPIEYVKHRISYSKTGQARFFGHLELADIMFRSFRRAGIPIEFSVGFHPKPKISFNDPLPVGMESLHETCIVSVKPMFSTAKMQEKLNGILPSGLEVTKWEIAPSKQDVMQPGKISYEIELKKGSFDRSLLETFKASKTFTVTRVNTKGLMALVDYKEHIENIEIIEPGRLILDIRSGQKQKLRPAEILSATFGLSEEELKTARIVKGFGDTRQ